MLGWSDLRELFSSLASIHINTTIKTFFFFKSVKSVVALFISCDVDEITGRTKSNKQNSVRMNVIHIPKYKNTLILVADNDYCELIFATYL